MTDLDAFHAAQSARVAARVRDDPHAPTWHFIAPEGEARPFDPNGAIYWNGRYHLFYIFQDPALPAGGHCWGHASSADLLHWTYHPTALAPAPRDPDRGIFSGGAFVNRDGVPTIIYHGVDAGTCIATSEDDDLIRWRKSPHNPVIPIPREGDPGWGVYNVFDPHAWVESGVTYAILGGKVKPYDLRDTAYLFCSHDLVHWDYLRPFYSPHPHWTGEEEDCACPDFFPVGDRHALVCISHPRGARYYLGRWQAGTFVPESHQRMNWPGGSCFAPETLLDGRGRRIFWAWVLDQRRGEGLVTDELGVMTMPRVLSLDGAAVHSAGRLAIAPPEELQALRRHPRRIEGLHLLAGEEHTLDAIRGDSLELALDAALSNNAVLQLKVRMSPDGQEQTVVAVDRGAGTLAVDTTRASLSADVFRRYPLAYAGAPQQDVPVQVAPLALAPGEPLALRLFLDRSILEVFANDRQCVTQRLYPSRADSQGVAVACGQGHAEIRSLEAWELAATNL